MAPVGRIYEDTSASTSADLRSCWSIRTYVQPVFGPDPFFGRDLLALLLVWLTC